MDIRVFPVCFVFFAIASNIKMSILVYKVFLLQGNASIIYWHHLVLLHIPLMKVKLSLCFIEVLAGTRDREYRE